MLENTPIALIAAGGNISSPRGDPLQAIVGAIKILSAPPLSLRAVSRFYATPCFPAGAGPDYVNGAFSLETELTSGQILQTLHGVEQEYSRNRLNRWGTRTLDLDLIALGDQVLPEAQTLRFWMDLPAHQQTQRTPDRLLLPHPRMQDRAFVLAPLMDIAPKWRHPLSGQTVAQMWAALPAADRAAVTPL